MRRTTAILAFHAPVVAVALLAFAWSLVPLATAGAHPGATPEIYAGQQASVNIRVPAEAMSPMVGVDITIADGFDLERWPVTGTWQVERRGSVLHYRGGPVPVFGFALFTLIGVADEPGELVFPVVLHAEDGSTIEWLDAEPGNEHPAPIVDVIEPPAGGAWGWVAGGLVAAAAVSGATALALRRRRPKPAPARSGRGPRGSGSSRPRTRRRSRPPRS